MKKKKKKKKKEFYSNYIMVKYCTEGTCLIVTSGEKCGSICVILCTHHVFCSAVL